MNRVFFDAASSAPLHPAAQQAYMAACTEGWADPTRVHTESARARQLLDAARSTVAECLGAAPERVFFTPSGSSANMAALLGAVRARGTASTLVHSAVEHSSVLYAAEEHIRAGGQSASIPVDHHGVLNLTVLERVLSEHPRAMLAVQHANHEVGTKQPLEEISEIAARAGTPLIVDAAATLGVCSPPTQWQILSASARKWGGPAGVGVLVIGVETLWASPWRASEAPMFFGHISIPAVVAAAAALRARLTTQESDAEQMRSITALLRSEIARTPDLRVVGHPSQRVPHIVTFTSLYIDGESLAVELNREGFAVSSGSSCTASSLQPSHVLEAMGQATHAHVRLSLHPENTLDEARRFLKVLPAVLERFQ